MGVLNAICSCDPGHIQSEERNKYFLSDSKLAPILKRDETIVSEEVGTVKSSQKMKLHEKHQISLGSNQYPMPNEEECHLGQHKYKCIKLNGAENLTYTFLDTKEINDTLKKITLIDAIQSNYNSLTELTKPCNAFPVLDTNSNSLSITPNSKLACILENLIFQGRIISYSKIKCLGLNLDLDSTNNATLGSEEFTQILKDKLSIFSRDMDATYDDTGRTTKEIIENLGRNSLNASNIRVELIIQKMLQSSKKLDAATFEQASLLTSTILADEHKMKDNSQQSDIRLENNVQNESLSKDLKSIAEGKDNDCGNCESVLPIIRTNDSDDQLIKPFKIIDPFNDKIIKNKNFSNEEHKQDFAPNQDNQHPKVTDEQSLHSSSAKKLEDSSNTEQLIKNDIIADRKDKSSQTNTKKMEVYIDDEGEDLVEFDEAYAGVF